MNSFSVNFMIAPDLLILLSDIWLDEYSTLGQNIHAQNLYMEYNALIANNKRIPSFIRNAHLEEIKKTQEVLINFNTLYGIQYTKYDLEEVH